MANRSLSRIGLLTASLGHSAGGVIQVLEHLQTEMNGCGLFDAHIFGARSSGVAETDFVHSHASVGVGQLWYLKGLAASLRAQRIDLLHLHGLWSYLSAFASRQRALGMPSVVSPHGMLDPWALAQSAWKKRLARFLVEDDMLKKANCVHALSEREVVDIRRIAPSTPICLIPNGVSMPVLREEAPSSRASRRVVFLSRIHPKKGVRELLEAWAQIDSKVRNGWELNIYGWGDGSYVRELKAFADSQSRELRISMLGPVFDAEKDDAFRQADIFVLPSRSEGLPIAVLEAWSYGVPVLMTDECNLPLGFQAEAARQTFCEPGRLAEDLTGMMTTAPQALHAMGGRGRSLVQAHYSWQRIAAQFAEVYHWILEKGKEPECLAR